MCNVMSLKSHPMKSTIKKLESYKFVNPLVGLCYNTPEVGYAITQPGPGLN